MDTTREAIERAKQLGTFNQVDRSKQYEGRHDPRMLLRSQDYLWRRIRERERQEWIRQLVTIVVSTAAAMASSIVVPMLLHRLGLR